MTGLDNGLDVKTERKWPGHTTPEDLRWVVEWVSVLPIELKNIRATQI